MTAISSLSACTSSWHLMAFKVHEVHEVHEVIWSQHILLPWAVRAAVVVGSAETNEGNPIQVTPMVVSGGSDAVKCREMLWIGERPGNDSHPDALSKILVSACRVNTATGNALDELMCKRHALFRNIRQSKKSSLFQFFVDSYLIKLTCEMSNVLNCQMWRVSSELIRSDSNRCCSELFEFCSPRGVKNFCSGCGAPRGSGPFCSQCGQRLETA